METIYLISKKNEEKIPTNIKNKIIIFETSYKISKNEKNSQKQYLTTADIAKDILNSFKNSKKIGTNNKEKAKKICRELNEPSDIYLVYSDTLPNTLKKQFLIIIEENELVESVETSKIYLCPPAPIIIEKIKTLFPNAEIETIFEEDKKQFQIEYYKKMQYKQN